MSIKAKRFTLLGGILVLTIVCYIVMNRNYDPLSRYPYEDEVAREAILNNMDELEIKYIIDYSIAPYEFMDYVYLPNYNAYYTSMYNVAKKKLIFLDNQQVVNVVNRIEAKKLDLDSLLEEYQFMFYDAIMERLSQA